MTQNTNDTTCFHAVLVVGDDILLRCAHNHITSDQARECVDRLNDMAYKHPLGTFEGVGQDSQHYDASMFLNESILSCGQKQ